jgi:CubicO group peptidase (beta-lactamase class C family)
MYYNTGYTLLGRLIEAVTDQTYSEYIVQNIFQPLDMERSTFTRETFEAETNVMTPYYYDGEQLQESEVPFDEHLHAAGGLLSSVTEIASFLSLYLGENKMPDVGIDADKLATMRQPQATMSTLLDGTEIKYGYGWMIQPLISDTLVGHGGWTGVSSAYCGGLLDAGLGVVIACNSGPDLTPMAIGKGVLSILQNQEPDQTISSLIIREKYSRITGEYTSYRGIQKATVEQDDQVLYLTQDTGLGEQTLPLIPEGFEPDDYTFYTITSSGTRVTADFCVGENEVELTFDRMCFVSSNHYIL